MIPQGGLGNNVGGQQAQQQTSRTYRIDPLTNRIVGMVDGLDALKQAVYKILQTERFEHLIYDESYGIETQGVIGSDPSNVQSKMKRSIREALIQDDRITDVTDFSMTVTGDEALIDFTIVSNLGNFKSSYGFTQ